jgi:hypothetical protein
VTGRRKITGENAETFADILGVRKQYILCLDDWMAVDIGFAKEFAAFIEIAPHYGLEIEISEDFRSIADKKPFAVSCGGKKRNITIAELALLRLNILKSVERCFEDICDIQDFAKPTTIDDELIGAVEAAIDIGKAKREEEQNGRSNKKG